MTRPLNFLCPAVLTSLFSDIHTRTDEMDAVTCVHEPTTRNFQERTWKYRMVQRSWVSFFQIFNREESYSSPRFVVCTRAYDRRLHGSPRFKEKTEFFSSVKNNVNWIYHRKKNLTIELKCITDNSKTNLRNFQIILISIKIIWFEIENLKKNVVRKHE